MGKRKLIVRKCLFCGKEFEVPRLKNGNVSPTRTCCKECARNLKHKTCIQKYGGISPFCSEKIRKKAKLTLKKNYGVDNPSQSKLIKDKKIKTSLFHYGVENPNEDTSVRAKIKKTNLKKYGFEYGFQNVEIQQKCYNTNLKRYGTKFPSKLEKFKEKRTKTLIRKYGQPNITALPSIQQKVYLTKKKNQSFCISSEEKYILRQLKMIFKDIYPQYKSQEYPFWCDFYIPELNLYIEYQGHISHGNCPFEEDNPEHLKIVEQWLQRAKEINFKGEPKTQYLSYVRVWTKKDPYKREIARKNNLNWIEFFNLKDFENWLNNFKKI